MSQPAGQHPNYYNKVGRSTLTEGERRKIGGLSAPVKFGTEKWRKALAEAATHPNFTLEPIGRPTDPIEWDGYLAAERSLVRTLATNKQQRLL